MIMMMMMMELLLLMYGVTLHVNFVKINLTVEEHLKIFGALEISRIMGENNKFSNLNTTTGSFLSFSIVGTHIVRNDELLHKYSRGMPNYMARQQGA
jgi:hypothetical protein